MDDRRAARRSFRVVLDGRGFPTLVDGAPRAAGQIALHEIRHDPELAALFALHAPAATLSVRAVDEHDGADAPARKTVVFVADHGDDEEECDGM